MRSPLSPVDSDNVIPGQSNTARKRPDRDFSSLLPYPILTFPVDARSIPSPSSLSHLFQDTQGRQLKVSTGSLKGGGVFYACHRRLTAGVRLCDFVLFLFVYDNRKVA